MRFDFAVDFVVVVVPQCSVDWADQTLLLLLTRGRRPFAAFVVVVVVVATRRNRLRRNSSWFCISLISIFKVPAREFERLNLPPSCALLLFFYSCSSHTRQLKARDFRCLVLLVSKISSWKKHYLISSRTKKKRTRVFAFLANEDESSKMGVKCFRLEKKKSVVCLFCRFFSFSLVCCVFSSREKRRNFFFFAPTRKTEMTRVISSRVLFLSLSLFFCRGTTPEEELVVCFGYRLFLDIILSLYF